MANVTQIPAPRVELIDPRTGLMSREWFRFFNNLYTLTGGGTTDTSLADLQLAPVYQLTSPDATAADLAPQTVTVAEPQFDLSPRFELGTLASQNADNITFGNLTVTGTATFSAGTANQVQYLNASKVLTGSVNLTFDGTTLTAAGFAGPHNGTVGAGTPNTGAFTTLSASSTVSGTGFSTYLASPPAIGSTAASTGAFTTLSASSTVSGTGFSTYLASPPAIGSTAASTGAFTTLSASSTVSGTGFSTYLASPPAIGSTAASTGAFTTLSASSTVSGTGFSTYLASPPAIGSTAASTGAFTTLSASSTVSGTGFSTYLASPPAIGSTAASTGAFTTLSASSTFTLSGGTANGVGYLNGSKVFTSGAALTFDGTNFATTGTASATKFIPTGGSATGNGMYLPAANTLAWSNGGTETARLDSAGNIGIGVTPSAWVSYHRGMDFGGGTNYGGLSARGDYVTLANNCYLDSSGSTWRYKNTSTATQFAQTGGGFVWYIAASGTAGNAITFTTSMVLDSAGNLTVPAMYGTTVTTPRNVFIDSAGKMGGISSTRASKTNIAPLVDVSWLYDLKPVSFNYRKRDEDGVYLAEFEREKQYGMIAEDTVPIAPDLCVFDDKGKVVGIHYDRMVAPLLKALQDQAARIDALEKKLGYHSQ